MCFLKGEKKYAWLGRNEINLVLIYFAVVVN